MLRARFPARPPSAAPTRTRDLGTSARTRASAGDERGAGSDGEGSRVEGRGGRRGEAPPPSPAPSSSSSRRSALLSAAAAAFASSSSATTVAITTAATSAADLLLPLPAAALLTSPTARLPRSPEAALRRSGLGYVVVRPGPLLEEPGGYRALVFDQGNRIARPISCADAADVCLKALHDPLARNKTFEVCYEYEPEAGLEQYELLAHLPDKANNYLSPALAVLEKNT